MRDREWKLYETGELYDLECRSWTKRCRSIESAGWRKIFDGAGEVEAGIRGDGLTNDSGTMQTHHPDLPALMPVRGGHHRCTQCDRIIYSDPKVAVAAIIPMGDGIVLLRRAIEPQTWQVEFPVGIR